MRKVIFAINITVDGCCDHTKQFVDEEKLEYFNAFSAVDSASKDNFRIARNRPQSATRIQSTSHESLTSRSSRSVVSRCGIRPRTDENFGL
jgi:hypothetical protein